MKEDSKKINPLGNVGLIGRFKPLHIGSALMLEAICSNAKHVKIGIGSSNKYDARNPFTSEETKEMIDLYLKPNYKNYGFIFIPDYGHIPEYRDGKKWKEQLIKEYGPLDYFISGNPYVSDLLTPDYKILHPAELIEPQYRIPIRGTMVRMAMAMGLDYKRAVPEVVADYLEKHHLVERFRKEFGLETLTLLNSDEWRLKADFKTEADYVRDGKL